MTRYADDVASDLSRFHRIDDPGQVEAVKFLRLAVRLFAYGGVLAARVRQERTEQPATSSALTVQQMRDQVRMQRSPRAGQVRHVSLSEIMTA